MKILLAIDDSKFSEAATHAVIAQFRPDQTEVLVMTVVEPILLAGPPQFAAQYALEMNKLEKEQLERSRKLVDEAAETLRKAGFKSNASVAEGDIRAGILDTAEKAGSDLIVVGSHGRRGLDRFLLGSVSDAVMRHARCSVEIVRPSLKG